MKLRTGALLKTEEGWGCRKPSQSGM